MAKASAPMAPDGRRRMADDNTDDDDQVDLLDDSDAATRLGYAGDTTPPSSEAVGPPPEQEGVPTPEELRAKSKVSSAATGTDTTDPLGSTLGKAGKSASALGESIRSSGTVTPDDPLRSAITGIRNYLTGQDAASKQDLNVALQQANPDGTLSPDVAIHKAIADTEDPYQKDALMKRGMHTYREARALARDALEGGAHRAPNVGQSDAFLNEGMKYLPDGNAIQLTRHQNGIVATISRLGTDKQDVINMTPQQYSAWLHSDASDADNLMRGDVADSMRKIAASERGAAGPGGPPTTAAVARPNVGPDYGPTPSQLTGAGSSPVGGKPPNAPVGVAAPGQLSPSASYDDIARNEAYAQAARGNEASVNPTVNPTYRSGNVMAQREDDLAARAQERRIAEAQGTSFENASNQLETARAGGFATEPLELRRDADGNLWTKDPKGNVVPYRQGGMKYATGEEVPSHTQGLSPTQAREFANRLPVQPGPQQAAVGGMPAPRPAPPRAAAGGGNYDTEGHQIGQAGGNYNAEGQEVRPREEEPAPQRSHSGFHRHGGGHKRRRNQGA